jgi:cation/acetate symporter
MPLAAAVTVGTPALNFAIFAFFVLVTLVIAIGAAGKNKSTTDYYAGGRNFTGWQNGAG